MKKRFFAAYLAISLCLSFLILPFSASATTLQEENYTPEFATFFAQSFLSTLTSDTIEVISIENVYSFDESVYGNKVVFKNEDTEEIGYLIFSLSGHIHEFSLNSIPEYLDDCVDKIYYNGGHDFIAKKTDSTYISSLGVVFDSAEKIEKNYVAADVNHIVYSGGNGDYGSGTIINNPQSTLPSSLTVISIEQDDIASYHQNYQSMEGVYSGTYDCGPIAILNTLIYYDNTNYPNMIPQSYTDTYYSLLALTNFNNEPISDTTVKNALYEYVNRRYPNQFTKYIDYYITHSDIIARTAEDNPFIYLVNGNGTYGNHFLVGLGYMKFECSYKGFLGITYYETNMFIRVADGWSTADTQRYINFADASYRSISWVLD